jgi:4-phytase / acid phosphatase
MHNGIARTQQLTPGRSEELRFVIYLSRHGVCSPIGSIEQIQRYSSSQWPAWTVPPGYLTQHGYRLMETFGAYDRRLLASEGLLKPAGCDDAHRITIHADSGQRTRETAKALAAGAFPGCDIPVDSLAEGHLLRIRPLSLTALDCF